MPTTITFLGHATFEIETAGKRLLIDPFLENNPQAPVDSNSVQPDFILLTHGHFDHIADCIPIAKRTSAQVIANADICHWLGDQGVKDTHPMHIGGAHQFEFGTLKLTIAHHGSMLPDGSYGGNPAGLLFTLEDGVVYFAGDTALTYDMTLLADAGIDIAFLPIGDNFTMGPDDALRAVEFLQPKRVVPCHYNTWPVIAADADAWAGRVTSTTSAAATVLKPGESIRL